MESSCRLYYEIRTPDRGLDARIQPDMQAGAESLLARSAAVPAIRRLVQDGQNPRVLHENATKRSSAHMSQRTRTKPWHSWPQARNFSNSLDELWIAKAVFRTIIARGVEECCEMVLHDAVEHGVLRLAAGIATRCRGDVGGVASVHIRRDIGRCHATWPASDLDGLGARSPSWCPPAGRSTVRRPDIGHIRRRSRERYDQTGDTFVARFTRNGRPVRQGLLRVPSTRIRLDAGPRRRRLLATRWRAGLELRGHAQSHAPATAGTSPTRPGTSPTRH